MASVSLANRVAALEAEVARLQAIVERKPRTANAEWLRVAWGAFAGDPALKEVEEYTKKRQRPRRGKVKARRQY